MPPRFKTRRMMRWAVRVARISRNEPRYREKLRRLLRAKHEAEAAYQDLVGHPSFK